MEKASILLLNYRHPLLTRVEMLVLVYIRSPNGNITWTISDNFVVIEFDIHYRNEQRQRIKTV